MNLDEYRTQLAEVNRAITAILTGAQEYKIGTRSVRRADLATLYAERSRLEGTIASAESGTTVAAVLRRG